VEISAVCPDLWKPCEQQNRADVIAKTGYLISTGADLTQTDGSTSA
jgi:hypothetical protein